MQDAEKLLDILSATGIDGVEQTRAATTTRMALYANVCFTLLNGVLAILTLHSVPSCRYAIGRCQSRRTPSRSF